jgi:hypothetical protein
VGIMKIGSKSKAARARLSPYVGAALAQASQKYTLAPDRRFNYGEFASNHFGSFA